MGGTIYPISDKQTISDLRNERDTLMNLLNDIFEAKNEKLRKLAIQKARDVMYPKKSEDTYPFWKARLDWWNHK